jgi:hypothetical protein
MECLHHCYSQSHHHVPALHSETSTTEDPTPESPAPTDVMRLKSSKRKVMIHINSVVLNALLCVESHPPSPYNPQDPVAREESCLNTFSFPTGELSCLQLCAILGPPHYLRQVIQVIAGCTLNEVD